jgi:hypothetical protein
MSETEFLITIIFVSSMVISGIHINLRFARIERNIDALRKSREDNLKITELQYDLFDDIYSRLRNK